MAERGRDALKAALAGKRLALGGWLVEGSLTLARAYADAGFDYLGIDCQHSLVDERDVARLLQVLPGAMPTVVRVSRNDAALIGLLLDAGADAVIIPGVDSAEDARRAAAAFTYPPAGTRSFGPIDSALGFHPVAIADRALCLVMIETAQGLAEAEEITSVDRVDGVYVGPADLSIALGLPVASAFDSDQLHEPIKKIQAACAARGLVVGAHATDPASARRWHGLGVQFVSVSSSTALVRSAAAALAADLRGVDVPDPQHAAGPYG